MNIDNIPTASQSDVYVNRMEEAVRKARDVIQSLCLKIKTLEDINKDLQEKLASYETKSSFFSRPSNSAAKTATINRAPKRLKLDLPPSSSSSSKLVVIDKDKSPLSIERDNVEEFGFAYDSDVHELGKGSDMAIELLSDDEKSDNEADPRTRARPATVAIESTTSVTPSQSNIHSTNSKSTGWTTQLTQIPLSPAICTRCKLLINDTGLYTLVIIKGKGLKVHGTDIFLPTPTALQILIQYMNMKSIYAIASATYYYKPLLIAKQLFVETSNIIKTLLNSASQSSIIDHLYDPTALFKVREWLTLVMYIRDSLSSAYVHSFIRHLKHRLFASLRRAVDQPLMSMFTGLNLHTNDPPEPTQHATSSSVHMAPQQNSLSSALSPGKQSNAVADVEKDIQADLFDLDDELLAGLSDDGNDEDGSATIAVESMDTSEDIKQDVSSGEPKAVNEEGGIDDEEEERGPETEAEGSKKLSPTRIQSDSFQLTLAARVYILAVTILMTVSKPTTLIYSYNILILTYACV